MNILAAALDALGDRGRAAMRLLTLWVATFVILAVWTRDTRSETATTCRESSGGQNSSFHRENDACITIGGCGRSYLKCRGAQEERWTRGLFFDDKYAVRIRPEKRRSSRLTGLTPTAHET